MTQSRHSFSVGGNKGSSMFNARSIIFTDLHSFVRIVDSLRQTNLLLLLIRIPIRYINWCV